MSSPKLSVILITCNEAHNLADCLTSLRGLADEIVIVDSGSRDATRDIAAQLGARVILTDDWPGFGPQKNRALDAARERLRVAAAEDIAARATLAAARESLPDDRARAILDALAALDTTETTTR